MIPSQNLQFVHKNGFKIEYYTLAISVHFFHTIKHFLFVRNLFSRKFARSLKSLPITSNVRIIEQVMMNCENKVW